MAILVDTPRWSAHGTLYGHLVSDQSLWELHAFARRLGLDPRAFDHDHYDLPAGRHADAVATGAEQVDERDLVRRLRAGGLRIAHQQHAPRRRRARSRVEQVFAPLLPAEVVGEMLDAYQAPTRRYHDVRHLDEMLTALNLLAHAQGRRGPTVAELLAVLFHDAVYDGVAGQDERRSADLAVARLSAGGHPVEVVAEVERLVLLTTTHRPDTGDDVGARFSDADLAILASAPGRYHVSVRDIRVEYSRFDDHQWRTGRRAVLEGFLASPRLYASHAGHELWERAARANISDELAHLDDL